jgi:NADP-dependent 3-hydroxy acid dehydrogenase YdfG
VVQESAERRSRGKSGHERAKISGPDGARHRLVIGDRRCDRAELARRGVAVAVHCRRSIDQAEAVVADIRRAGGEAAAFAADLGDTGELQGLVKNAAERLGPIAILVNKGELQVGAGGVATQPKCEQ